MLFELIYHQSGSAGSAVLPPCEEAAGRLLLAERALGGDGHARRQLVDDVYLPLLGDNLAKQLGATGDAKRTDQMGLRLLISPPGYGKTTLMEYVADRLGLVFVKVNGPALGHQVTSIDPAEAPNATARQEIEKISFALEMGNNVLLYLDDIQHTNPELLQKFISLCDAQRRMEGVWDGRTRTYDLRGKRFAVCMAGHPYPEAGQRFRIPDMLANRADVWNLGDVLSGRDELFALSYIENALTSNPVLAPLTTRSRDEIRLLARMAGGDDSVRPDQLDHPYSAVELEQIMAVLRKLLRVQQVVLAVNQAYIASAAQADASRTEPPFRLQGSYRNMNRLAERIVPVMNDDELEAVIDDHYVGEAQTLSSGAEANLLKLAELRGRLTPGQAKRWAEVKAGHLREQALGGSQADPPARAARPGARVAARAARRRTRRSRAPGGSVRPTGRRSGGGVCVAVARDLVEAGRTVQEIPLLPGRLLRIGIGEAPIGLQGTFSLWRNSDAMRAFAYRALAHREVIRRSSDEHWYAEELFARFAVLDVEGTFEGRTP